MEKTRGCDFLGLTIWHGEGPVTVPRDPELLLCPSAPGGWAADCDRGVRLPDTPTAGGLWPTQAAVCTPTPVTECVHVLYSGGSRYKAPGRPRGPAHVVAAADACRKLRVDFQSVPAMCARSPYVPDMGLPHSDPDKEASPRSSAEGRPQTPSSDSGVSLSADSSPPRITRSRRRSRVGANGGFTRPTQDSGDGCPDADLPPSSAGTSLDVSPSSALPFRHVDPECVPCPPTPKPLLCLCGRRTKPAQVPRQPERPCVHPCRTSLAPLSSPVSPGLRTTPTVRHSPANARGL